MESKSREAFESWALSECGTADITKVEGRYFHPKTRVMWEAWQASRAALVVELPPVSDVESDDTDVGYNIFHRSVQEKLTNQGLAFHVQGSERWITVKGEGDAGIHSARNE